MKKIKRFRFQKNVISVMTSNQKAQIEGRKLILACTCYCVGNKETGNVSFKNSTGTCPYAL